MPDALTAASGRWPELLMELGGLSAEQLTDRHQPCPACGGTDRYRWDRDEAEGGWFCNQCGGKDNRGGAGSGIDLLMRIRGWSLPDACRAVEQHLGLAAPRPEPPTAGAEHVWRYSLDFYVCRFPGKRIRPLWWDGSRWAWKAPPGIRPLYWASPLRPGPVLVVEGEKAADAAVRLFPSYACCTWPSGCKALGKANWQPLAGREVLLWPDADEVGREAMAKLAARLLELGCSVTVVDPPAHLPAGWDLADAGDWTPTQAAAVVKQSGRRLEPPAAAPAATLVTEPAAEPLEVPRQPPFVLLGFDNGNYYYQPANTGQIVCLQRASHSSTNLLALAELPYWQTVYPGKTGVDWSSAVSSLFAQQAAVGVFCPDKVRGRGAWWDEGRAVLHLGNRLIVDGATHSVMAPPRSVFNYQRLASIDIPNGLPPLSDHEGMELLDIANRFLWEVPASGLLMAGWVALAPICGALSWRPHAWLTASAGSGKTALLDRYVGTLLDSLALWPEGATTEAFIRQTLNCDALPVVFDEAESNEKADRDRIQNILTLARVASSSGRGVIGKGGADGAAQRFTIRSMFLLCSISTALKQGADQSRFAQLTLRNPNNLPKAQRVAHWTALDSDLTAFVTPEVGHRLLLRSVSLIPVIRDSVAVFRRAAADRFDSQRQGDQYGTLLAGAWSLYSSEVPTEAQAFGLIDGNDWEAYRESTEQPDEIRCIQLILQHQVRVEGDRGNAYHRAVGELVDLANPASTTTSLEISAGAAAAHLGRIGLRVDGDRLLVSNTAQGIRKILNDTAWAHSWPTVLSRIAGSSKTPVVRFHNGPGGVSRAAALPLSSL